MAGEEVVRRARMLLGVPFRFQGRWSVAPEADDERPGDERPDRAGVDCVGLAAFAHDLRDVPDHYALRATTDTRWIAALDDRLRRVPGPALPGDVMLLRAGPALLHLGIWTGAGMIHAHAGLRRVVETPGPPPWPVLGHWRSRKDG